MIRTTGIDRHNRKNVVLTVALCYAIWFVAYSKDTPLLELVRSDSSTSETKQSTSDDSELLGSILASTLTNQFSCGSSIFAANDQYPQNFIAFTSVFDLGGGGGGWAGNVNLFKVAELSIASAVNLGTPLIVLTHATFPSLDELCQLTEKYPYLTVQVLPNEELVLDNNQWVATVESFKVAFLKFYNHLQSSSLLYVELDQLFLPKSGTTFADAFHEDTFDVGFTYLEQTGQFGSVNTGVIFYNTNEGVVIFFQKMLDTLLSKYPRTSGGENQKIIDYFVPFLKNGENYTLDTEQQSIFVKAFKYPGPFNYNAMGCCKLPLDTLVAHFKSLKKSYILSACCRDRAFPDKEDVRRESWKASCDCNQQAARLNTECWMQTNTSTKDDGWCDTTK